MPAASDQDYPPRKAGKRGIMECYPRTTVYIAVAVSLCLILQLIEMVTG